MASSSGKFTFADLCCGIGGFHLGLAGPSSTCILACDIDPSCRETYEKNYGIKVQDDIFKLDDQAVVCDVLAAGFPCQSFSRAGLQRGMADERAKVYDKIVSIVEHSKPKIVLLENVKNLVIINHGAVLQQIRQDFRDLGYRMTYAVLNTRHFGLAQNRERVFLVCVDESRCAAPFDFSRLESRNNTTTLDQVCRSPDDVATEECVPEDDFTLLGSNVWKTQRSGLIFCGYLNKKQRTNGTRPNTLHLSRVHKQPNRIYHIHGTHPTLSSSESSGRYFIYDTRHVRRMTLDECYRIQGFPEDFQKHPKKNKAFSHVGNSVCPIIIKEIKEELIRQGLI